MMGIAKNSIYLYISALVICATITYTSNAANPQSPFGSAKPVTFRYVSEHVTPLLVFNKADSEQNRSIKKKKFLELLRCYYETLYEQHVHPVTQPQPYCYLPEDHTPPTSREALRVWLNKRVDQVYELEAEEFAAENQAFQILQEKGYGCLLTKLGHK